MKRVDILSKIRENYEFVVEIGAGPAPYHRTNVIVDKYPFDNFERCANIQAVAPVIKADAVYLPFREKTIDLLFISQVVEHLPDPILFLKEAKRVAKDIYIETPSPVREVIFGWSFHRWVIRVEGSKWIFHKNDLAQLCSSHFHNENDIFFIEYTANNFDKFNNYYYGPVSSLEFEMSPATALEYLTEINQRKTDFPSSLIDVSYVRKIGALLYLLMKNIIPVGVKLILKKAAFAMKRSGYSNATDFGVASKGRLMCIFCKKPMNDINVVCACGVAIKRVNGILSFDADDYPSS